MAISEEQFNQLLESNRTLTARLAQLSEGQALQSAERVVATELARYVSLPKPTRERLAATLPAQFTLTESGTLDIAALQETVKNAATDALAYLNQLGLKTGDITDLGGVGSGGTFNLAETEKRIAENLAEI